MKTRFRWILGAIAALVAFPALAEAQRGRVIGKVTDAQTGLPVQDVQVSAVGLNLATLTLQDGTFNLRNVPAGAQQIRVLRIGYAEQKQTVTIKAGEAVTVDFKLDKRALTLTPIVATATGNQRRAEVPNQIAQIDASKVLAEAQVNNVSDLLIAKAAGVQVLPGNQIGAGARIRIRGTSSLSLNNDPVVFVDGVRIESSSNSQILGVGGSAQGRLNDINPEDIENIDVIRGPAASALYGTDAANGVIVITTKRGKAGPARWSVYTEQGVIQDRNTYPTNYLNWGRNATTNAVTTCTNATIATGACISDSIRTFNIFANPRATPLRDGYRRQYGVQVSGGTDAVTYFVAAEGEGQSGTFTIPQFDLERARARNIALQEAWLNPNNMIKQSLRANIDIRANDQLTIPVRTFYTNSNLRLPNNDNNVTGLYGSSILGFGDPRFTAANGDTLFGYANFTPLNIFQRVNRSDVQRFIGSVSPTWNPTSWLQARANLGVDFTSQTDDDTCLNGQCTDFGQNRLGFRNSTRARIFQYTADASATATFRPLSWLQSNTTGGFQYVENNFNRNGAFGQQLPPGALTVSQASVFTADEATTLVKTVGFFVEQRLGLWDRLDIVGSVRGDNNSAFGRNFTTAYYPRVGASYRISEERWFPLKRQIDQVRLRTSWGQAGTRPGTTAALPFFGSSPVRIAAAEVPGLVFNALGNANLKPETVTEYEGGIDVTMWGERLSLTFTAYEKYSQDALLNRVLPPSIGSGATARFENIGQIRNSGYEYIIGVRPIDTRNLGLDLTINGSYNTNKILRLGVPPIVGATISQRENWPLNAYFQRPYTFNDANNNRIIEASEITYDTVSFIGYSIPRTEITTQAGMDLLNKQFRIAALFDYKGGHRLLNNTDRFRCTNFNNARNRVDPSASLEDQARCVAALPGPNQSFTGFMEDASFIRFRELALTWRVPQSLVSKLPASRNASITVAGRNLALWTDYTGIDPEQAYGQGDVPLELLTQPPLRSFTVRVNLGF